MDPALDERLRDSPVAVVLSADLFFSMRLKSALASLGLHTRVVTSEAGYLAAVAEDSPAIAFIDFNRPVDWPVLAPGFGEGRPSVVAFGPHKDVDGFAAARQAGVTRVIANGALERSLPVLVERYADRNGPM